MSGGFFEYKNLLLKDWADAIGRYFSSKWKELEGEEPYDKDTTNMILVAADLCDLLDIILHRVDYLIEGDDAEYDFHRRLWGDINDMHAMRTPAGIDFRIGLEHLISKNYVNRQIKK